MVRIPANSLGLLTIPCLLCAAISSGSSVGFPFAREDEECTIALLSGAATADGRPLLWKNRDTGVIDNEVVYFDDGVCRYVALVDAGQTNKAWIGVNDKGFAILNALSYNIADSLQGGITNGELMKRALQTCATVEDFEDLLRQTNAPGRENPANLAVLDGIGGGAIFEAGNRSWRRFDVGDPVHAPEGHLVRANFSLSADTSAVVTYRYHRCRALLKERLAGGKIDLTYLLGRVARDIRPFDLDPYPLPFAGAPPDWPDAEGYVDASDTINRRSSSAGGIIAGVLPGEDPLLSTFYALVGQPVVTIALPVWVAAGTTPTELDGKVTSPLCDLSIQRRSASYDYPFNASFLNTHRLVNPSRTAYLAQVERVERWLLPETDRQIKRWRDLGIDPTDMAKVEARLAAQAFAAYQGGSLPLPEPAVEILATPNPTRGGAEIRIVGRRAVPAEASLEILDVAGRRIARVVPSAAAGDGDAFRWDGRDARGRSVAPGVYLARPSWTPDPSAIRIVVTR